MTKNGTPNGMHTVTAHLVVKGAAKAIEFYKKAFGAEEVYRLSTPDGKIAHAEIRIGDSPIWISDEQPNMGAIAQASPGATTLHLFVAKVDEVYARALDAGAKSVLPPTDMFWGARYGQVADAFGHRWSLATQTREVSATEMQDAMKRQAAAPATA